MQLPREDPYAVDSRRSVHLQSPCAGPVLLHCGRCPRAKNTTTQRVFGALRWPWDSQRSLDMLNVTDAYYFTESRLFGGQGGHEVRIRWAGVVKVADDVGRVLEEARAHLEAGRLRAAGVVAAVELERRLWNLGVRPTPSKGRDPGLHDYRLAARAARIIDQQTDTELETLAVIRKRCAHFHQREPTPDEVKQLVDGVDRILRKNPVQKDPTT